MGYAEYDLAEALDRMMQFDEARRHTARAVEIAEAALGPEHPAVAQLLDGHAETLEELGQTADAIAAHRRALAIQDKAGLALDDPWRLVTLKGLGIDLLEMKDYAHAIEYLERAKDLVLPESAADVADAKFALAQAIAVDKHEMGRARQLAAQARDVYRKTSLAAREKRNLGRIEAWLDRTGNPVD